MQATEGQPSGSTEPRRDSNSRIPDNSLSKCEMLKWDGTTGAYALGVLDSAKALQDELDQITTRSPVPAPVVGVSSDRANNTDALNSRGKPTIMIYGLPQEILGVLLGKPLGIDPMFIEAHAGRRGYRSTFYQEECPGNDQPFTNLIYPELMKDSRLSPRGVELMLPLEPHRQRDGDIVIRSTDKNKVDLMGPTVVRYLSNEPGYVSRHVVALCRLSLWTTAWVDVVFLEKQVWKNGGGGTPLKKARMANHSVMKLSRAIRQAAWLESPVVKFDLEDYEGDEAPSLRTLLVQARKRSTTSMGDVLKNLVYDHWICLLEQPVLDGQLECIRDCLQRLITNAERNEDIIRDGFRRRPSTNDDREGNSIPPLLDWARISERLQRRLIWSSIEHELEDSTRDLSETSSTGSLPISRKKRSSSRRMGRMHSHTTTKAVDLDFSTPESTAQTSQQALDRVTFLGAILLPVSIVSGMLSMSESFQPGAHLFWVFWAISVPLIAFVVLVILIDKERVTEVWTSVPSWESESASYGEAPLSLAGRQSAHSSVQEGNHIVHSSPGAGKS